METEQRRRVGRREAVALGDAFHGDTPSDTADVDGIKGPPGRVQFSRLSDPYPRRAVLRAEDMSLSDRDQAGAFEAISITFLSTTGQSVRRDRAKAFETSFATTSPSITATTVEPTKPHCNQGVGLHTQLYAPLSVNNLFLTYL